MPIFWLDFLPVGLATLFTENKRNADMNITEITYAEWLMTAQLIYPVAKKLFKKVQKMARKSTNGQASW